MLLPVLREFDQSKYQVEALIHAGLTSNSPRVSKALGDLKVRQISVRRDWRKIEILPRLFKASALITAADTTAKAHAPANKLVKLANVMGVRTFTLQHGLENNGLTYYDHEFTPEIVDFASQTIFTWCALSELHPGVPKHIKARCRPVGCPKEYRADLVPDVKVPGGAEKVVGIFENLHWARYSDDYRSKFLEDLVAAATSLPHVTFLVKPHHAGRWLTTKFKGKLLDLKNILILNPQDPQWEPYTAPSIIKISNAVITTPSTTAFDAVCLGKLPAVVGYDLDLKAYAPLRILRGGNDWTEFISAALDEKEAQTLLIDAGAFKRRSAIDGQSANQLVKEIVSTI